MERDMREANTFVFRGTLKPENSNNPFHETFCGLTPSAWSRGEALAEREELEDFVRDLRDGKYEDLIDAENAAGQLMEKQGFA